MVGSQVNYVPSACYKFTKDSNGNYPFELSVQRGNNTKILTKDEIDRHVRSPIFDDVKVHSVVHTWNGVIVKTYLDTTVDIEVVLSPAVTLVFSRVKQSNNKKLNTYSFKELV